ncbi:MAG TPA: TIGR03862 family flavoprotein [Rhodocyclaceae bacterium]|nr:TIGR03862 family flavoprotein [Rhodocyclaceae bacterium]
MTIARIPVAVVGGGPAGLMAAEVLAAAGVPVEVFDAMPSVGRKFLMAGKGGMNITHSEPPEAFLARYGPRAGLLAPLLDSFGPEALRAWIHGLGIATFIGSSGRVFPEGMKAAPLLRAWLHRLRGQGVRFHVRHRWLGWDADTNLRFSTPTGHFTTRAEATVLALGGGSWAKLGSDGTWVPILRRREIPVADLRPANCGFDVAAGGPGGRGWSPHFRARFAGQPVKSVAIQAGMGAAVDRRTGDVMITATGVEGGPVYGLSAVLRDRIEAAGAVTMHVDLLPGRTVEQVRREVAHPRGSRSLSGHLQSRLNLRGVKTALLRECLPKEAFSAPESLAAAIKALPLTLAAPRPIDEAISSAGGVDFSGLDGSMMLNALPGVFCAGEMLDWEAPTGGYLLTACFATGRQAGRGALGWLSHAGGPP